MGDSTVCVWDDRVTVVNAGVGISDAFTAAGTATATDRPYFVNVSNLREHKNIGVVLDSLCDVDADVTMLIPPAEAEEARRPRWPQARQYRCTPCTASPTGTSRSCIEGLLPPSCRLGSRRFASLRPRIGRATHRSSTGRDACPSQGLGGDHGWAVEGLTDIAGRRDATRAALARLLRVEPPPGRCTAGIVPPARVDQVLSDMGRGVSA